MHATNYIRSTRLVGFSEVFILGLPALAQNATGTLVGHVKDASGAVIPNADVTVTNVDTGEAKTLTTNGAADFTAPLAQARQLPGDGLGCGI